MRKFLKSLKNWGQRLKGLSSMDIKTHPIWTQITPYKTKISNLKKPFHLLKIYLARQYAKLYSSDTFVGVTGSVGKTTTVSALYAVLSQKYKTITTTPNLDPILNIPQTLLKLNPSIKKVILEMGCEYPGEIDFYLRLVKPKYVVVTKISYAHSKFLGDINQIMEEKGKLVEGLPEDGVAVLNYDDVNSQKLADKCRGRVYYFGMDSKNCTVWAGNIKFENFQTVFELNLGVERIQVKLKLLGEHQVYSALAAATMGVILDIPLMKIKKALELIEPTPHRLEILTGPFGSTIIDDTYNSSPQAVEAAIDTLVKLPSKRKILVLGEMRELGKYSEHFHRAVAQKIYKEKIDYIFLGGGEANFIADELNSLGFWEEKMEINLSNSQIVSRLLKILEKGDICLIKGSRAVRLDEVVKRIVKLGH